MKIAIIVGRFQLDELHTGHKSLIERAGAESDKVVILLGCCVPKLSLKNPLDFETRKTMVQEVYPNIICYPIYDNESDKVWSDNLDEIIDKLHRKFMDYRGFEATLHHSRDSFRSHYSGNYPCKEWVAIDEDNGTARRAEIAQMKPLVSKDFRTGVIYASSHQYPKVLATVDAFVYNHKTKQVLLARRKSVKEWRLFGGFSDPTLDDSFKLACQRELQEESGLTIPIGNFECIDSFKIDDWRYRSGVDKIITTLFWVDYDGDQENKVAGADDIFEVSWFDIKQVVKKYADPYALTYSQVDIVEEHWILINAAYFHYKNFINNENN